MAKHTVVLCAVVALAGCASPGPGGQAADSGGNDAVASLVVLSAPSPREVEVRFTSHREDFAVLRSQFYLVNETGASKSEEFFATAQFGPLAFPYSARLDTNESASGIISFSFSKHGRYLLKYDANGADIRAHVTIPS